MKQLSRRTFLKNTVISGMGALTLSTLSDIKLVQAAPSEQSTVYIPLLQGTGNGNPFSPNLPEHEGIAQIAQDIVEGAKYDLAVAASRLNLQYEPGSFGSNVQRLMHSLPQDKLTDMQDSMDSLIHADVSLRKSTFGRYGARTPQQIHESGIIGLEGLLSPLEIQSDSVTRSASAHSPDIVAASDSVSAAGAISDGYVVDRLGFYVSSIKCVRETRDPIWRDNISIGGIEVDEDGDNSRHDFQYIAHFNAGKRVYLNKDEGGWQFTNFNIEELPIYAENGDEWPKSYSCTLLLSEKDNGGASEFLNEFWQETGVFIRAAIVQLAKQQGYIRGGRWGAAIGSAIGRAAAWGTDYLVNWTIKTWKDDVFSPLTKTCTATGTNPRFEDSNGNWTSLKSQTFPIYFNSYGGEYVAQCYWKVYSS